MNNTIADYALAALAFATALFIAAAGVSIILIAFKDWRDK